MSNDSASNIKDNLDMAACILFYEKVDQTIECIQSLLDSGIRIYVLNNNSTAISRKILGTFCDQYDCITIFDSDSNLGVSKGRNYLIKNTNEKWLFFIDNDITIMNKNWLDVIGKYIRKYSNIEVFIPKLFNLPENNYSVYSSFRINGDKVVTYNNIYYKIRNYTNYFPGGASIINRNLFDRIGSYDDKMFTGWEDFELSVRAIISGKPVRCMQVKEIELVHDHRPVIKDEDKKAVKTRYDINLLQNSYNRIYEKYGLVIDDNWKPWVKTQIKNLIKDNDEK